MSEFFFQIDKGESLSYIEEIFRAFSTDRQNRGISDEEYSKNPTVYNAMCVNRPDNLLNTENLIGYKILQYKHKLRSLFILGMSPEDLSSGKLEFSQKVLEKFRSEKYEVDHDFTGILDCSGVDDKSGDLFLTEITTRGRRYPIYVYSDTHKIWYTEDQDCLAILDFSDYIPYKKHQREAQLN